MNNPSSIENNVIEQLAEPSQSTTHNKKKFKVFIFAVLFLILGTGAYLFVITINKSQYVQQQSSSSPTISQPDSYPRSIYYNYDSKLKNAAGSRLFAGISVERPTSQFPYDELVYATILDGKTQPIKFCERCSENVLINDLNELGISPYTFKDNLEKSRYIPPIDSDYASLPKNMQELISVLGIFISYLSDRISPDKKQLAFITYILDSPVEKYPAFSIEPDKFYIQEIVSGNRRAFNLPDGAQNWRIRGWSQDGTKIYLSRRYYEAHGFAPDGLLIFDVKSGSVNRIPIADKLSYPLRYDSIRQIFYGLEAEVGEDGAELKLPTTIWKIEVPSGLTKSIFTSNKDIIYIDNFIDKGTLIFATQDVESKSRITNGVWILDPGGLEPINLPVQFTKEPEYACWGSGECGLGRKFVVSNDNRFIAWVIDSKIWVYDRNSKKQWIAVDINELGEIASNEIELKQFVIF